MMNLDIKPTAWIQTYSGHKFDPWDPDPKTIDINDIAHALSLACRWGGHCTQFYSVAQHSVLMSRMVDYPYALIGLLHDASEAYIGDMPAPIKATLPDYKHLEDIIMVAVAKRFNFYWPMPDNVKQWDMWWTKVEAYNLLEDTSVVDYWAVENPAPQFELECWDSEYAEFQFLDQYYRILSTDERTTDITVVN